MQSGTSGGRSKWAAECRLLPRCKTCQRLLQSQRSSRCRRRSQPCIANAKALRREGSLHGYFQSLPLRLRNFPGGEVVRGKQAVTADAQSPAQPGLLTGLFEAIQAGLQQQSAQSQPTPASLTVDALCFQPPGAAAPLLQNVSLELPAASMGLVYGQSGSGKTTLLQILAGLAKASSGAAAVRAGQYGFASTPAQLAASVGLVFQFPERHFLGSTIFDEMTFAWPADPWQRQAASIQLVEVLAAVDLDHISIRTPLRQLSDGYKRRVALAVQLARQPSLLLLDEPLAGLDWRARADVAGVLGNVKKQCTVLAVSHDLRELVPLVDHAWRMEPGGILKPSVWPPPPEQQF